MFQISARSQADPGFIEFETHRIVVKRTKRARGVRLKISAKGEVSLSTPPWVEVQELERFVAQNSEWLQKNLTKILASKERSLDPNTISLFGKKYRRQLVVTSVTAPGVTIQAETLTLTTQSENTQTRTKMLDSFFKRTAEAYIVPRTHALAKTMRLEFRSITLREQSTRWGSCSSQKRLNFNWRLVHFAPAIIDYVIIHELAHLVHMNHSAQFWQLVAQYDPEYKQHKTWLRKHGLMLD